MAVSARNSCCVKLSPVDAGNTGVTVVTDADSEYAGAAAAMQARAPGAMMEEKSIMKSLFEIDEERKEILF